MDYIILISKMGNALEGKTYVKGSQQKIQPRIVSNVDNYKTQQRISSSSNIHHSQLSFTRPKSEHAVSKKPVKKLVDDIQQINDE